VECWREALTVAPITRIHASSDAAGVFEHVTIGALRHRGKGRLPRGLPLQPDEGRGRARPALFAFLHRAPDRDAGTDLERGARPTGRDRVRVGRAPGRALDDAAEVGL
jgi:hypothetical protein